jgi:hypothetical protein
VGEAENQNLRARKPRGLGIKTCLGLWPTVISGWLHNLSKLWLCHLYSLSSVQPHRVAFGINNNMPGIPSRAFTAGGHSSLLCLDPALNRPTVDLSAIQSLLYIGLGMWLKLE